MIERARARALVFAATILACAACGDDDDDKNGLEDGEPCMLATDCASGECLALSEGLRCGRTCEDADACGANEACGIAIVADQAAGVCAPAGPGAAGAACSQDADCAGRLCEDALCLAPCDASCTGECATRTLVRGGHDVDRDVCPPALPGPDLVLGPFATGADGQSEETTFTVPDGVAAFTVTVVDDDGLRVAVAQLTAPDGTIVADADGDPEGLQRVNNYIGAAAVLVPATDDPAAQVRPGTYRLRVGTYDPAVFDSLVPVAGTVERVEVVFTREGTQGGVLDLVLHWAPALGVTAADAATQPFVTDALAMMQALLGPGRVRIGTVEHADLTVDANAVEDGNEARTLCKTVATPGPHGRSVNVMLVQSIGFGTTGFAGGIPGPTGVYGTNASGIVAQSLGSGHDTGILLAHEVGHFLGLRHTTELGARYDDVSDTPECPGGTEVSQCPDYSNLMFPVFPLWDSLALTPAQIAILSASPLLTEVRADAACATAPFVDDVTEAHWAAGDTSRLPSAFAGTCGGDGPEAVHLLRVLRSDVSSLAVRVTAYGFAPVVHVRKGGDCSDDAAEVACSAGTAGTELTVPIDPPEPGPYFVFVDGAPGGAYVLAVDET